MPKIFAVICIFTLSMISVSFTVWGVPITVGLGLITVEVIDLMRGRAALD